MPGPPPKAKSVRQNRIKRPELGIVPVDEPVAVVPKPPKGLLPASRRIWRDYWASPVAKVVDLNADQHRLDRWIQAVDEYERVYAVFRKGRLVKGSKQQPVLNPLASYLTSLMGEISKAENELGLTPLARLRLGIAYGQAQMTAMDLNKALEELEPREEEPWEQEWAPA